MGLWNHALNDATGAEPVTHRDTRIRKVKIMVGPARFELATSTPPVWRATRLRYGPTGKGDDNDDELEDNLFRSPVTSP